MQVALAASDRENASLKSIIKDYESGRAAEVATGELRMRNAHLEAKVIEIDYSNATKMNSYLFMSYCSPFISNKPCILLIIYVLSICRCRLLWKGPANLMSS